MGQEIVTRWEILLLNTHLVLRERDVKLVVEELVLLVIKLEILLLAAIKEIVPELLSDHIRQRHRPSPHSDGDLKSAVRDLEEEMIRDTLARFGQNKSRTARALGISRQSLLKKLRNMGL